MAITPNRKGPVGFNPIQQFQWLTCYEGYKKEAADCRMQETASFFMLCVNNGNGLKKEKIIKLMFFSKIYVNKLRILSIYIQSIIFL